MTKDEAIRLAKDEAMEEIRDNISLLRKYAYEFGLTNDMETHGLMMSAQRRTFEAIDKPANAIEERQREIDAKI